MGDSRIQFEADLTWTRGRFEPDVRVVADASGTIQAVQSREAPDVASIRLPGLALLPGFVNAHSHAFQRGLRGRGERFPRRAGSFWSWREEMYRLVGELDEERLYRLCLYCFQEMLAAGITCAGEFHYLHHASEGQDFTFDSVVLQAAADSGIRLVLLLAYYRTGGVGKDLQPGQRRFYTRNPETYWKQMDRLQRLVDPATQTLGAVVHSVRAASIEEIREIYREARRRDLAFHIHVEEQPQELEECRSRYGIGPMALLMRELDVGPALTAVHCTHTKPTRLQAFLDAGGSVCICPLTEANLGDGIPDPVSAVAGGGPLCLGTDSNLRICFLEEMRWLEYVQRLSQQRRGIFIDPAGSVSKRLLEAATVGGARSLGLNLGRIEADLPADFIAVDLNHPALRGWTPESLLDCLIFGGGNAVIQAAFVAGRQVWSQADSS